MMSRYGGRLIDVARVPFLAYLDLAEAARVNTPTMEEIEASSKQGSTDAQVSTFFKGGR